MAWTFRNPTHLIPFDSVCVVSRRQFLGLAGAIPAPVGDRSDGPSPETPSTGTPSAIDPVSFSTFSGGREA